MTLRKIMAYPTGAGCPVFVKVRTLMRRLDRQAEFDEYVEVLHLEYKRKRTFMKLLEQLG